MKIETFTRQELLARLHISRQDLEKWVALKLVGPVGFAPNKVPIFSDAARQRIEHIQKLADLGYRQEDIQKIMKKVGLPSEKLIKKEARTLERFLTVGDLAQKSGVSPRTIKHWEDKGIIEPDMRSEGGFRLYSKAFVYLCQLIRDLQLFGYSLEEIKRVSVYVRDFLAIQEKPEAFPKAAVAAKLDKMLAEINSLFDKTDLFKQGVARWEDLLKKKKKEILGLKEKNQKRHESRGGNAHA